MRHASSALPYSLRMRGAPHVTFDLARNQLARSIDVMLEENSTLPAPLSLRKPEREFPGATDTHPHAARASRGRDQQEQALRLAHARLPRPRPWLTATPDAG